MQDDPLSFEAGPNFYTYADNNPIVFNDPTGNCPVCFFAIPAIVGAGFGGLSAAIQPDATRDSIIRGTMLGGTMGLVWGGMAAFGGAAALSPLMGEAGATLFANVATSSAVSMSTNMIHQAQQGSPWSWGQVGAVGVGGAAAAVLPAVIPSVTAGATLSATGQVLLGVLEGEVAFGTQQLGDIIAKRVYGCSAN